MSKTHRICLGAFAGAHGVKGDAKIKTFTENESGVADYGPVETEDGRQRFTLRFIRVLKPGLALVAAPEIKNREEAAMLAGTRLYVDRKRFPELEDDAYYVEDLVGLAAFDDSGAPVGHVSAVHDFGAGQVIEISRPGGGALLIPFTRDAAPVVDLAGGRIVIATAAMAEISAGQAGASD